MTPDNNEKLKVIAEWTGWPDSGNGLEWRALRWQGQDYWVNADSINNPLFIAALLPVWRKVCDELRHRKPIKQDLNEDRLKKKAVHALAYGTLTDFLNVLYMIISLILTPLKKQ